MTTERIKELPIPELADENAHLWMWVTNASLPDGLECIRHWKFIFRNTFKWVKPRMGLGHYLRNSSEMCIFATRGKAPVKFKGQMDWGFMPVTNTHSEKPREMIPIIERLSHGPYCELFCRKRPASREKWWCWGNETEEGADFFIPGFPVPKYSFEKDKTEKEEV